MCAAWLQSERAPVYRGASTELGLRAGIWDEVILNRLTMGQQQSFLCVPASFEGRGCNVGTCLERAQTELDTCMCVPPEVVPSRRTSGQHSRQLCE